MSLALVQRLLACLLRRHRRVVRTVLPLLLYVARVAQPEELTFETQELNGDGIFLYEGVPETCLMIFLGKQAYTSHSTSRNHLPPERRAGCASKALEVMPVTEGVRETERRI
jgi:hypothetical protein